MVRLPPLVRGLFDTDGDRHAKVGHPIEDRTSDSRLRLLIGQSPGVKSPSNDGLVAKHRRFNQASSAITRAPLPLHPAVPVDRSKMRIALRRSALAHDSRRPRRNDHISLGVTSRNFIVDHFGVVGSISRERRDGINDVIEQRARSRGVINIFLGQFNRR